MQIANALKFISGGVATRVTRIIHNTKALQVDNAVKLIPDAEMCKVRRTNTNFRGEKEQR